MNIILAFFNTHPEIIGMAIGVVILVLLRGFLIYLANHGYQWAQSVENSITDFLNAVILHTPLTHVMKPAERPYPEKKEE